MKLFSEHGIEFVPHFTPLHYLPFIARSRSLKSKPALASDGFSDSHFRTKSKRQDVSRGFGEYAFLTLSQNPRIVVAKLKGGFPHIAINVPVAAFEKVDFDLCRFNVAMARRKPTSPTGGFPASDTNGRYYGKKTLPIARTVSDKKSLLAKHYPAGTMIEVLVRDRLPLPQNTTITCYSQGDQILAQRVLDALKVPWQLEISAPPGKYKRASQYVTLVQTFINRALLDANWRGNGIEFDKV
jgi:hypothetical protein